MANQNRRSQIFIEPYKQMRFGLTFILINLLFALIFLAVFGFFIWDIYGATVEFFSLSPAEQGVVAAKFSYPLLAIALLAVFFVVTTLWCAARYTHQFYGPLVSIRRFLDTLLRGEETAAIKIRKTDQLQDIVLRLNKLLITRATGPRSDSVAKLEQVVDALVAGQPIPKVEFSDGDPLGAIARKLGQVARNSS